MKHAKMIAGDMKQEIYVNMCEDFQLKTQAHNITVSSSSHLTARNKTVRVHRIGLQQTKIRYSGHVLKVPFAEEQVAMEISVLNIHTLTQQLLGLSTPVFIMNSIRHSPAVGKTSFTALRNGAGI
jgi:hypothetical protein